MSQADLIQRLFDDDFQMLEGTRLDLNVTTTSVPINAYLATLLNDQLTRLEIEPLTNNQAKVGVTVSLKKFGSVSRDFLIEMEGGIGPRNGEVLTLHIRNGFKTVDGLALLFTRKLNQNLPPGVRFVREFKKDRFCLQLRELFDGLEMGQFFDLIETFEVKTKGGKFRVGVALAADR